MPSRVVLTVGVLATVVTAALSANGGGSLPGDKRMAYKIYADPGNPKSAVTMTVTFELSAVSRSGDTVDWDVDKVTFDEASGSQRQWTKLSPSVSTSSGYWTVDHDDADQVVPADFDDLPFMQGTATSPTLGVPSLTYDLEGDPYIGQSPYNQSATELEYALQLAGESEPIEESEEDGEPVEVDEPIDPN
ncbi:MAG: hypothetical protein ACPGXK_10975 [Phycisphaerae bacterium]